MLGVSYPGWPTVMAMLDPHPALKAVSPQASPADMCLGDDFHHNGAFRLSYGFEYAAMMEASKDVQQFAFDNYDTFDWYLKLGSLANVNEKYLHGKIPTWNDFVAHPELRRFWKRQTDDAVPHEREGADAERRRLVGPGRLLRARHDLRRRSRSTTRRAELSRRRAVESWRLERRQRRQTLGPIDFGSDTAPSTSARTSRRRCSPIG